MNIPLAGALLVCVLASRAVAQTVPIAGRLPERPAQASSPAPRLADGRPDLGNGKGAWNPRVIANLAGVGDPERSPVEHDRRCPVSSRGRRPFTSYARPISSSTIPSRDACRRVIPRLMATPFPFQIFQQSDRVLFVFEGGAHVWRTIFTDGRPHPKDPNPSFLGDSVGRWDGDTLVVDVVGFNEATWLDQAGHPHTEALHIVERFTRTNETTLHYEVTIDDPHAYTSRGRRATRSHGWPAPSCSNTSARKTTRISPHMVGK